MVAHALQVSERGARDVLVGNSDTVLRGTPHVDDSGLLGHLTVYEEEQFVLDDRAADGGTVGGHLEFLAGLTDLGALYGVTAHVLVAVEDVGTATELVGTALGHSVHTTTDEVGLTNIVGRNNDLHLLDSLDTDGVATTRQVVAKTEVVVEVGTVNGEVGSTAIGTGETHTVTTEGRQTGNVRQAAGNSGQIGNLGTVDVGSGTGLLGTELGGCCGHNNLAKGVGINAHVDIQVGGLGKLQHHAFNIIGLITHIAHRYGVGATGTHTLDGVTAIHVGHGIVLRARGRVQSGDRRTNHRLLVFIGHNTR